MQSLMNMMLADLSIPLKTIVLSIFLSIASALALNFLKKSMEIRIRSAAIAMKNAIM